MTKRTAARAAVTGTLAAALLGLAPHVALAAAPAPPAPAKASVSAARDAAAAPATLDTLARFFAAAPGKKGAAAVAADTAPHVEGATVPVYALSPDFVRGRRRTGRRNGFPRAADRRLVRPARRPRRASGRRGPQGGGPARHHRRRLPEAGGHGVRRQAPRLRVRQAR